MKVSEAIERLKSLNPNDDVIIAWWEADAFPDLNWDQWEYLTHLDDTRKIDWSETWDMLSAHAKEGTPDGGYVRTHCGNN